MYEIHVIESNGPGMLIDVFDTLSQAKEYISKTGIAYEYYYGVVIVDTDTDKYDCGDGVFSAFEDCWQME